MSFHGLPINPIFLHVLSLSLHLVLLVPFSISWARNGSKHKFQSTLFYPKPLFCALAMPLVSHFYWCYKNGWSNPNQEFLNLLNFVLKTVIWGLFNLGQRRRFLFLFRAWYAFYFLIFFCHSFAINIGLYGKNAFFFPIQCLIISDFVGLLFFCYLVRKEGKYSNFHDQEPLLSDIGITPYSKAGIFSILTFSWVGPLIASGNKKALELEDIPQLTSEDSVFDAFSSFRNKLEAQCGVITTLKLVKSLILLAWKEVLLTGFFALLNTLASYVGPYLIQTFVQYLNGEGRFKSDGYLLVSAFFVAKLIESLSQRQCLFRLKQVGIRIEALLMTLIYSKTMTLSFESKQSYASGEIINLMSVDAKRIGDLSRCVHDMWTVVLQVALSLFILYRSLGMASLAAFAATVILMLANVPVGWLQDKFQGKLMESKDKRMKATSEVLRNMRILKLQGWEMKFLSKIMKLRMTEQVWLKKYVYTIAISVFALYVTPTFVSLVTFGTCMLIGIPLDPGKILSALATFRILQGSIHNLPESISMIAHTKVSLDRIASFLRLDDLQCDVVEKLPRESSNTAIRIIDGNFSWDLSSPNATLKNINLTIFHGMRVAICGTVGSGKSSLLSCILGEVPKVSGTLRVCGRKAFVGQSPWIQSDKIQENILFGDEMDRERYENVLEACSLKKDLEILPFGDQTIVGERGINLSGGQKQRIQLARALYQDADIYMLDDPFSAVDAHTGSHLFKECILSLLSSKTVIYITHQVEFLPAADLILVMKDGKITQFGKYNDLLNSGTDFMELVGAHRKALVSLDSLDGGAVSDKLSTSAQEAKKDMKNDNKTSDIVETKGQLIQKEEREKGKVGFSVYWKYITTAYGGAFVPLILFIHIVYEILQIGSNYWMAWATSFSSNEKSPVTVVYIALGIATTFCIFIRVMLLAAVGYKTAAILFQKLHLCIFRAPMSFFDATPSGRIINRASTDQSSLDADIPYQVGSFAFLVIQLLGNIAVMSQAAWQVFIIFIPVISISVWYQQYYLPSARELARLVGVCKAPVIQHFAETISGTTTIRSFDQESRFEKENMKVIDQYSRPKFNIAAAMEWLCFRLDMLSSITFAFCLMFLISIPKGVIDPGIAGLAVTYGLTLKKIQSSLILRLCSMENKIISVERILQYTCIPSEPPLVIEENQPNPSWPSNGEVNICDLQVRYAPHLPVVLRGITCKFHGGLKTGIVGRTGSGKSTLIQTLFRMIEPCAGKIVIDGINISSIGLHDLRNRLSIIPQDPTMFEGTVRSNLDPLQEYSDEQIWEVLDKCQLADKVRKKEGQLGSTVCENGENWSMGERQLVCLGRVLLKKSKILVLDEATASVDTATDSIIHQILSQNFCDSTLITIAHRISSVLHSHMILLLNQGVVEEYESPSRLLEDKSSSFSQLVGEYSMRSKATSVDK